MIVYEVTAEVPHDAAEAYERYQRGRHIPDVMATGCFREAALERGGAPAADGALRYRARYVATSAAELARYLRDHAPALRAHFARHAPPGVRLARAEWTVAEWWSA